MLLFGTAQNARVPELNGSGAPAAVLGAQHPGVLLACKGSRMPAAKMRIGLVSGIVNIDMNNQY
jgi:hypothetical protein